MINLPCLKPSLLFYTPPPLIPLMTSNTTPSGLCYTGSLVWSYPAYYAFDRNDNTYTSNVASVTTQNIYYEFPSAHIVTRLYMVSYGFYGSIVIFQGSNDGVIWYNLGNTPYTLDVSIDDTFQNSIAYQYYQWTISNATPTFGFRTIQLYGK